tara:strand:+ start:241 stop:1023 length:783 start_codon:yes stop_codon:yes gene_type:complete
VRHHRVAAFRVGGNYAVGVNIKTDVTGVEDRKSNLFHTLARNSVTLSHLHNQGRSARSESSMQFIQCMNPASVHMNRMLCAQADKGSIKLRTRDSRVRDGIARRSLPRSTQLRDISEEHARNMAFNVTRELALKDRRAFADELHASNKTSFYKHYSRQTIHEHIISGSRDQSLSTLLVSIKTAHESLNVSSMQKQASLQKIVSSTEKRAAGYVGVLEANIYSLVDRLNAERGKLAEAKNQILEYSKERRRFVEQMRNLRS